MSWLLDTNVLLRLADAQSPEHASAEATIEHLIAREESVFITTQVLVEFWAVATRPAPANGLGWSAATTAEAIRALRDQFPLLNETPDVLDRWLELVDRFQVAGKRTHDARLAAHRDSAPRSTLRVKLASLPGRLASFLTVPRPDRAPLCSLPHHPRNTRSRYN